MFSLFSQDSYYDYHGCLNNALQTDYIGRYKKRTYQGKNPCMEGTTRTRFEYLNAKELKWQLVSQI